MKLAFYLDTTTFRKMALEAIEIIYGIKYVLH